MTTNKKVPTGYVPNGSFEADAIHPSRRVVADKFARLKTALLDDLTSAAEATRLQDSLEYAANEAASLAWTTSYPLLVFPGLFAEIAAKVHQHANRQKSIRGRSEMLLAETV